MRTVRFAKSVQREIQQAESVTDLYYEEYPTIYVDVQLLCDIIERYQIEILTYSRMKLNVGTKTMI